MLLARRLALTVVVTALAVTPVRAQPGLGQKIDARLARIVDSGLRKGDRLVRSFTADDAHQKLGLRNGGQVELGGLIGKGFYGAVYHLDASAASPLAIKLPHGWRHSPLRALRRWLSGGKQDEVAQASFITKARLRAEISTRTFLDDHVALAEASPLYPAAPAWQKGSVPVVPILEVLDTERGPAVVKPFVRGLSPGKLLSRPGGLTPAMDRSLRELYDFIQAMHDGVRIRRGTGFGKLVLAAPGRGSGLSLDARPANLMWVEDAKTLSTLGLSRPSFVFVELDQAFGNAGQYLAKRTSFEAYRDEVLRSAAAAN